MKVCIIQPKYSTDYTQSDTYFAAELEFLAQCDASMDLIVLPEATDIPCLAHTKVESEASAEKYNATILKAAAETAKRCNAVLFINARSQGKDGKLRNTTYAFDRNGRLAGTYFKQHLTPGEITNLQLDSAYTYRPSAPTIMEIDGIRYGFLTCYDFYFYEIFANLARYDLDIIIGCSHQRSDTHQALDVIGRFLAYNTNAYLVRASVSMDEASTIGGCSMVVAPDGTKLLDLKSEVGLATVEIDPKKKYHKPAGFGGEMAAHYQYIEAGRRPWKYRPAGSAILPKDDILPYPRVCAHRGLHIAAPENSMLSFGAAIAMGASELELDLRITKDGQIVCCHDDELERVSNGNGTIATHTYEELLALDFSGNYRAAFGKLRIPTLEEILQKFACHTILNLHCKFGVEQANCLPRILELLKAYDCEGHVYFMTGDEALLALLQKHAPHIKRCAGAGNDPWGIVARALRYNCKKVQFLKPYLNEEMIEQAHENDIRCNVFWSDDPTEAKLFFEMGIDTVLTNAYGQIAPVLNTLFLKS